MTTIYNNRTKAAVFHDVTYSAFGDYGGTFAVAGYNLCPGVGTPIGYLDK